VRVDWPGLVIKELRQRLVVGAVFFEVVPICRTMTRTSKAMVFPGVDIHAQGVTLSAFTIWAVYPDISAGIRDFSGNGHLDGLGIKRVCHRRPFPPGQSGDPETGFYGR
jgi:hypothetical protein